MTSIREVANKLKHHISSFEKDLAKIRSSISHIESQNEIYYASNREILESIIQKALDGVVIGEWYQVLEAEFGSEVANIVQSMRDEVHQDTKRLVVAIEERKEVPEQLERVRTTRWKISDKIRHLKKELAFVQSFSAFDYAREIVDLMSAGEYESAKDSGPLASIFSSKVRLVKKYTKELDNPRYKDCEILFFSMTNNPFDVIEEYRAYIDNISAEKFKVSDLTKQEAELDREMAKDRSLKNQLSALEDFGQGMVLISNLLKRCLSYNTEFLTAYAESKAEGESLTYIENCAKIKVNQKIKLELEADANNLNKVIGNLERALKKIPYSKRSSGKSVRRFNMADFEDKMLNTSSALSYKNNWYSNRKDHMFGTVNSNGDVTINLLYWMLIMDFFSPQEGLDYTGAALIFNDELSEIQGQVSVDGVDITDGIDVSESLNGVMDMSDIQDMMGGDLDMSSIQDSMNEITRTMDSLSSDMSSLTSDLNTSDFGTTDSFSGSSDW